LPSALLTVSDCFFRPCLVDDLIRVVGELAFLTAVFQMPPPVADQSDNVELEQCIALYETDFGIVIDEGSHRVEHTVTSFVHLFWLVVSGGWRINQDLPAAVLDAGTQQSSRLKLAATHKFSLAFISRTHVGKLLVAVMKSAGPHQPGGLLAPDLGMPC